ncbi:MAG: hypothetical protein HY001_04310, partial [Candidatus Portnoybacteria bacterium]|nr:hypothetical protein [Candidatus Portnoybacteria bacterium]
YNKEPLFAQNCHEIVHEIGSVAYGMYAKNTHFTLTPKTAYCSYGFYHAFMENFVLSGVSPKKIRDFCLTVDKQLGSQTPDAFLQCFHGIGHGALNIRDLAAWGNENALLGPALKLCKEVSATKGELSRCATGAFNTLALAYIKGDYRLSLKRDDPLWICRKQVEYHKRDCYISMNIVLMWLTQNDFPRAAKFVEGIPEDTYAIPAIRNLAAVVALSYFNIKDYTTPILDCRALQERLRFSCLQGFAYGFLEHGVPEREYIKPLDFCQSAMLTDPEKRACLGYIFSYFVQWYPLRKAYQICDTLEKAQRQFCYDEVSRASKTRSL